MARGRASSRVSFMKFMDSMKMVRSALEKSRNSRSQILSNVNPFGSHDIRG
jgi:hypothetical protein